jgi:hypothetical protein
MMANEQVSREIEKLWQSQTPEPPHISLEDLRGRMQRFERKVFWRNIREYVAGAIVVVVYGCYEWRFPELLLRIGSGLTIAGTLFVMFQLHRRASAETAPADLGRSTYVEFHRKELLRQRDALRAVWWWYLLPFVPGLGIFLAGLAQRAVNAARLAGHPLSALQIADFIAVSGSFIVVVFAGVWLLNRWSSGRLQKEIDALDALTRDLNQQG